MSVVWTPPDDVLDTTRIGVFAQRCGLRTHEELWRWSVEEPEAFWSTVADALGVRFHQQPTAVLTGTMPEARWFDGATLNYTEHALGTDDDLDRPAILGRSQTREDVDLTFGELRDQVARARRVLSDLGVGRGDRVVAYLPNVPETVVAFLATASLGAIWASCALEFGARSVIDRFGQVDPVVLVVAGGYRYGAKDVDRGEQVREVRAALPSLRHVVDIGYGGFRVAGAELWADLLDAAEPLPGAEPVAFDHPLAVLFSSGTTGRPKPIVHGHGGIVVEHLKNHALSWDLGPDDTLLWYSTTAWMMWNALVSGLLTRTTIVTLDGHPSHPDLLWQWRLAEATGTTMMGAAPGFVMACRAAGVDLSGLDLRIRTVGSAGSPLPPEGYAWLYEQLGGEVFLNVGSGGTDVCSGLVQGDPLLPVRAGRISGRALGVDAHAWDEAGHEVIGEPGELVITSPLPSMPVGLWGDESGERLRESYFSTYPGVWRHGDWIVFEPDGSCVVTGRSDATLNRGGVRLGTAEFYRVVEEMPPVADSLVVHLEDPAGGNGELLLFVALADDAALDQELRDQITKELRTALSPRHVPDRIEQVPAVPRNLTGKKLELPVKRILQGKPLDEVSGPDTRAVLEPFVAMAR
ncbi:acetoacetate--CoA ligase [Nocardioides mangrovicus]|uniref:Acetoacetate--CoA ligase n=1 Tax=Nocardioides mangrovicus TaxID=2478913 RepID=A0A3L8P0B1_9ACTN|nr:acetoacetate--CoA ligase [Nocardioides mangrovicus]RLV48233.1 acetoacetate--CoA ligase [Nocardioides mangrovicus]